MYTLHIKNWFNQTRTPRLPGWHNITDRIHHIVNDSRFWPIVGLIVLIAMLVVVSVWAILHPELNRSIGESPPFIFN